MSEQIRKDLERYMHERLDKAMCDAGDRYATMDIPPQEFFADAGYQLLAMAAHVLSRNTNAPGEVFGRMLAEMVDKRRSKHGAATD